MKRFGSTRKAKEFLAGKIAEEAELQGASLSEVERKMLYFSEAGWTLSDMMEVSAAFDRDFDQDEYEAKIAGLIQSFLQHTQAENKEELDVWTEAVEKLREEDHYLLVMIDAVRPSVERRWSWLPSLSDFDLNRSVALREPGDLLRLCLTALVCVIGMFTVWTLLALVFGPDWMEYGRQIR